MVKKSEHIIYDSSVIEIVDNSINNINVKDIKLEGTCDADYPLQKKRHSFEFLREISHLRPRANTFMAVFRSSIIASSSAVISSYCSLLIFFNLALETSIS